MTNYETVALALSPLDEARMEIVALRTQLEHERRAHAETRATMAARAAADIIVWQRVKPILDMVVSGELVRAKEVM
ncbi:MAG: hypothetical protein EBT79_05980 [Actinobacteria bacterium]|nr:hypothetical protein [Actinomycetota bacterium]NBR66819.1 hypothetical protein [Actinomycetota bacterium]